MSTFEERQAEIIRLRRELARLEWDSERAMIARAKLPSGSSRARVTTANARWSQCAEARERVRARIESMATEETA